MLQISEDARPILVNFHQSKNLSCRNVAIIEETEENSRNQKQHPKVIAEYICLRLGETKLFYKCEHVIPKMLIDEHARLLRDDLIDKTCFEDLIFGEGSLKLNHDGSIRLHFPLRRHTAKTAFDISPSIPKVKINHNSGCGLGCCFEAKHFKERNDNPSIGKLLLYNI